MADTIFINGRFLSQAATGVQRYALETLLSLDELVEQSAGALGFSFVVLAPQGAQKPPLRAIAFRSAGRLRGHAWEQVTLPRLTRGRLLLSFCPTGPALKRGQIVTIHDAAVYSVPDSYHWRFRLWYRLLLPLLARRARLVMTVSEFSKSEIVARLPVHAGRVQVSGEGWQHVQRVVADPSALERHRLLPGGYVLAVGSPSPHKNLAVLARAMGSVSVAGAQLAIAGAADRSIFGAASSAPREDHVRYLGYVDDSALRTLYEHAAAFVFPSRYEGFGLPPLEAMALGCPVIAARAGAIPEVCGDGVWYFDPDDHHGLAALIDRTLSDPTARGALVQRGRAVLQRHSWQAAARAHLRACERMMAEVQGRCALMGGSTRSSTRAPIGGTAVRAPRWRR